MPKCGGCGKFLSGTDLSSCKCASCATTYHRACVALPSTGHIKATWRCSTCKSKPRDITSVGGSSPSLNVDEGAPREECLNTPALDSTVESDLAQELRQFIRDELILNRAEFTKELRLIRTEFVDELRAVRDEIRDYRAEMMQIKSSVALYTERLDRLECKVGQLEKRIQESPNVAELGSTVMQLKKDLNDREQDSLTSDVEISNLPEKPGESLVHLTLLVASKLNVKLEESDITSVARVGGRQIRADSAGGPALARPRIVAVRLARPELRDSLLRSARVRRGATTADFGVTDEPRKFYVNERLTKYNRLLFRTAREVGKESGWKFVWTKQGRTYARREQGSPVVKILCEDDIAKLRVPISK